MSAASQPLTGVRVLDLSRVLAGPWCTQILGDFGADVLKVVAPGRGDDTRAWGPPFLRDAEGTERPDESAYYLACNRNKRSIAIDLADPNGAALVRRLAEKADIVVENFKVGGLRRYGLDYDTLSAINPRLVYCSITGFGQSGPYADRPGYDFVAQGMGGIMSLTGEEDGEPLKSGVAMCDLTTGLYAAIGIMMALRHADATGEGQHVDAALFDTQVATLANQAMSWLVGGVEPTRMGNRHPTVVPYKTFAASDGPIVIAVGNDRQFRLLCAELGRPELADDPRFARNRDRAVNRDAIEALLQGLVARETGAKLIERLLAVGVPAGPVNSVSQVFADPGVAARGMVHRFVETDGTEIPSVAFPAKLSRTPAQFRRAPPSIGEHGAELVADWLGEG
jgi:crotonobetainyl-CoA:carnitine CoA-transferase CaiB-like acyl-CoA transferase